MPERSTTVTVDGAKLPVRVTAPARGARATVVLAHGAGGDMRAVLLVALARGLAERGLRVVRFDFAYRAAGRSIPEPMPKLVRAWEAVAAFARDLGSGALVVGGKSMGGRAASMAAAAGLRCDGLVFLGYPLHPAGKKDKLRDAHLPDIAPPMLFVQGTRDSLCDLDLLRPVLARVGRRARLHVVEGGDHSLDVPKRSGRTRAEVQGEVAEAIARWVGDLAG